MPKLKIEHDTETRMTSVTIDDEKIGLIREISFRQTVEDLVPQVDISMWSPNPEDIPFGDAKKMQVSLGADAATKVRSLLEHLSYVSGLDSTQMSISAQRKFRYVDNEDGTRSIFHDAEDPALRGQELVRYVPVPEEQDAPIQKTENGNFSEWSGDRAKLFNARDDTPPPPSKRAG